MEKKEYHLKPHFSNDMRNYYQDAEIVNDYIKERFSDSIGIIQHKAHIHLINEVIRRYKLIKVLEIAPGPARITKEIQGNIFGFALDISRNMLLVAKKRLKKSSNEWNLLLGDAFKLPYKSNSIDFVISFRFIRHFKRKNRIKLYQEIIRVLKPNGFFIFDAPNFDVEFLYRKIVGFEKFPIFDKLWKKKELIDELNFNKFKLVILKNNINHYFFYRIINLLDHLLKGNVSRKLIEKMESNPSKKPLEWCVLCRKT